MVLRFGTTSWASSDAFGSGLSFRRDDLLGGSAVSFVAFLLAAVGGGVRDDRGDDSMFVWLLLLFFGGLPRRATFFVGACDDADDDDDGGGGAVAVVAAAADEKGSRLASDDGVVRIRLEARVTTKSPSLSSRTDAPTCKKSVRDTARPGKWTTPNVVECEAQPARRLLFLRSGCSLLMLLTCNGSSIRSTVVMDGTRQN